MTADNNRVDRAYYTIEQCIKGQDGEPVWLPIGYHTTSEHGDCALAALYYYRNMGYKVRLLKQGEVQDD